MIQLGATGSGRTHILVSMLLLALYAGACAAIDVASHSERVANYFDRRAEATGRASRRAYVHTGPFGDEFNGLLLVEAPQTDYDAGGVYFFGSSSLVFVAHVENLPPGEQKLIHDYGFPAANPTQIRQFIEYLDRTYGFLSRGHEKTCVALCLTENDILEDPAAGWFLPSGLRDTGLLNYDARAGITPVAMSGWRREWTIRKLRWYELGQQVQRMTQHLPPVGVHADLEAFGAEVTRLLAVSPAGSIERQLAEVAQTIDYVKSRGVDVVVVRLPKGSWAENSELDRAFTKQIPAMCAARGVSLLDLSHLLGDDEFMDAHHPNFDGALKVRDALEQFARDRLEQWGIRAR